MFSEEKMINLTRELRNVIVNAQAYPDVRENISQTVDNRITDQVKSLVLKQVDTQVCYEIRLLCWLQSNWYTAI